MKKIYLRKWRKLIDYYFEEKEYYEEEIEYEEEDEKEIEKIIYEYKYLYTETFNNIMK